MYPDASYTSLTAKRLRHSYRLLALITGATLTGCVVGLAAMIAQVPLLAFPVFLAVAIIVAIPLGLVLALPVTAFLLPVTAVLFERLNLNRRLLVPVGMLGGVFVTTAAFTNGQFWLADKTHWPFIIAGACAGAAAGWFFARTRTHEP